MVLAALLACAAAAAVALASAAGGAQAQEEGPSCFGAPATIVGTEGNDVIEGTPRADVIVGLGGSDTIKGRAGADRICGGKNPEPNAPEVWPEILEGGKGNDRISGGAGQDDIHGNTSSSGYSFYEPWPEGVHDDDILKGGPGFDTLVDRRSPDVDKLYGGSTDDRLYGNDGDYLDLLDAGAQDYSVFDEPDRRGDYCSGDLATDGTAQDTAVDCEWGVWLDWGNLE
jgi:Ca2+-binding RTX toxin-like protein